MRFDRAGFWRRLAAALMDGALIYSVSSLLIAVARLATLRVSLEQVFPAVAVVYGVVCLVFWAATPGKALLGLRVERKNGEAMNAGAAFLREGVAKWGLTAVLPVWAAAQLARGVWVASVFEMLVLFLVMLLGLAYWLFAKATWYDQLTRTFVTREAGQGALSARTAFAAVAVTVLLCGAAKAAEYFQKGWISGQLALFNNGKSTEPYVTFLQRTHPTPVDYVMGLFDRYDVVVLCERDHPEFTQWETIYELVSDRRFIDRVGHVFTEYGLRNTQPVLDEFLNAPDLSEAGLAAGALRVMRGISIWPFWNNTNFHAYLKKLYRLNQTLPREKRIRHYFTEVALDWDAIRAKRNFRSYLSNRDREMSEVVIGTMAGIAASEPRKKCLVVMNYRHAFGPIRNRTGKLMDNTGGYLFEAFPGKAANVLLVNLIPIVPAYAATIMAPVQGGVWDAAFEEAGNRPAGFDMAGSPFGADSFDLFPFDPRLGARYRYQDVFTGYIFDRPLNEQFSERGIPGLFEGVENVVRERSKAIDAGTYAITQEMIANYSVTRRERPFHQTGQTLVESSLLAAAGAGLLLAALAFASRRRS